MTAITENTSEVTCSSGRQWLFNGEMRSPSIALSPPSKCRCGLTCLVFNILYPREFSTEGLKNNNNKTKSTHNSNNSRMP